MFRDMLHLFIYFNIDRAYAQYYNTMGCRAGIQSLTYLTLTACRRTTIWPTPHPLIYALSSELHPTLWASLHPLLSYAGPSELRRTLWATPRSLSYTAPSELRCIFWATPHRIWLMCAQLRETVSRDLSTSVFYDSVSLKPQSIPLGPFPIISKIRGDICSSRCTTCVVDTGGK